MLDTCTTDYELPSNHERKILQIDIFPSGYYAVVQIRIQSDQALVLLSNPNSVKRVTIDQIWTTQDLSKKKKALV